MSHYDERFYKDALVHEALAAFNLTPVSIAQPLFGSNAVVRAVVRGVVRGETGSLVLAVRIHRPSRASEQIEAELAFVQKLHEEGLAVPVPLRTKDGRFVVKVRNGELCCSLLSWLSGTTRQPGRGLGPVGVRQAGRLLGQLHQVSETLEPSFREGVSKNHLSRLLMREGERVAQYLPSVVPFTEQLQQRLKPVFSDHRTGLLHGDFILKNLLYEGRTVRVLDFDDCTVDCLLLDFAGMLENLDGYGNRKALTAALLSGYQETGRDTALVADNTAVLIALRHYAGIVWAIGMHEEKRLTTEYFSRVTTHRAQEIVRLLS